MEETRKERTNERKSIARIRDLHTSYETRANKRSSNTNRTIRTRPTTRSSGETEQNIEREREREGHFRLPVFAPRQILTTGVARPYWRLPLGVIVDDRESTSREGREPDNPSVDPKRAEEVTRSSSKSCRRRHIRGAVHRLLRTNFRFFTRTSRSLRRRFVAAHSYRCRRLP